MFSILVHTLHMTKDDLDRVKEAQKSLTYQELCDKFSKIFLEAARDAQEDYYIAKNDEEYTLIEIFVEYLKYRSSRSDMLFFEHLLKLPEFFAKAYMKTLLKLNNLALSMYMCPVSYMNDQGEFIRREIEFVKVENH